MSRRSIIECDRCGAITGDRERDREVWALGYVATVSGKDLLGSSETPADLCGHCSSELRAFLLKARETDAEA